MRSQYYCNINGKFGMGAYEKPEYPELKDLLNHMDRLGIWQTVAYHSNACDLHPVFGNRFLFEDIEKTPGAKERIIPAIAANPAMLVGNGEMEYLEDCLINKKAAVIVLFPVTNRFRFVEYKRVFDRIRKYNPVILMDVTELKSEDMEDLANIAPEYPELKFILKQVMWWQFSRVLDLLHRTKNIYMDTSWIHTRDTLNIVCEQVGADRLVFGIGRKAHNGAAIVSLSWINQDQSVKDKIAYNNFVSLLPEWAKEEVYNNRRSVEDKINNRFWKDFVNEKGIGNDVLVIDAHTHIGPFNRSWYLKENEIDNQIKTFEKEMKAFGIDKIISQPETALFGQPIEGNRMVEEAVKGKHDRFRGNLVFNPFYSELYTEELLDEFFKGGYYCGFKLLPQYLEVAVSDPRFYPAYEYANKYHLHILFHSWTDDYGSPKKIAEIAKKYPNATFIIGHSGGENWGRRESEEVAMDPQYSNCMFEFCGSFVTDISWEESFEKISYKRLVFGTDTVVHDVAWEMGRFLSLDIPEEWMVDILGNNMQKILDKSKLYK